MLAKTPNRLHLSWLSGLVLVACMSSEGDSASRSAQRVDRAVTEGESPDPGKSSREDLLRRASEPVRGLTAVAGIRVGHHTLKERPTGCTVVLAEAGAVGAVDVRGGAPATRETDLLRPENLVQEIHAVVLSGGSAYGLDSASGVMRYLADKEIGFPVRGTVVPIVVGASLLDLGLGGFERPGPECGYLAASAASDAPVDEGNVGAGAGATVGKLRGLEHAMKGGVGSFDIELANGLVVAALVAVNALGDVIDPKSGRVVAGVLDDRGELADARRLVLENAVSRSTGAQAETDRHANTTLGVVATNAPLTQAQATKVAQMAHDGLARTLYPAHTPADGDTLFVIATGNQGEEVDLVTVGALAADAVAEAVLRAVFAAKTVEGIPAASDRAHP